MVKQTLITLSVLASLTNNTFADDRFSAIDGIKLLCEAELFWADNYWKLDPWTGSPKFVEFVLTENGPSVAFHKIVISTDVESLEPYDCSIKAEATFDQLTENYVSWIASEGSNDNSCGAMQTKAEPNKSGTIDIGRREFFIANGPPLSNLMKPRKTEFKVDRETLSLTWNHSIGFDEITNQCRIISAQDSEEWLAKFKHSLFEAQNALAKEKKAKRKF